MRVDGRRLADRLLDRLADETAASTAVPGCLGTLVVDDDALSHRQAALKHRACERVGLRWRSRSLPAAASTEDVLTALAGLVEEADGLFVHLPMPAHVDTDRVVAAIPPDQDIDGLRPASPFVAASAAAALDVLRFHEVPLARGRVAVLGGSSALTRGLGRSLAPVVASLRTVDPHDPGAAEACRAAEVVVSAAYRPRLVTGEWVRDGGVVVDAASGDVDIETVGPRAGLLCASPGGIGPVTVARLLIATREAATRRR